jgi:hypothetical protein
VMGNGGEMPAVAIGVNRPAIAIPLHFAPERPLRQMRPVRDLVAEQGLPDVDRPKRAREMVVVDDIDVCFPGPRI